MPRHLEPATRNTRDRTRAYSRRWWSDLVRRYQPDCFAVIPAGKSRADKVRHLFSCAGLSHGNCRWYAFESEDDRHRFMLDHPTARACDNPVKGA